MSLAKFKVVGQFAGGRAIPGTVIIDRAAGLFSVRPHRRHKAYELPLHVVAEMVMWKLVQAEIREKKLAKKRKRA